MLDWDEIQEKARAVSKLASELEYATAALQPLEACRLIGNLNLAASDLAAEVALMAVHLGATQALVADALRVPASTLSGAKAQVAAILAQRGEATRA
jgi:hypothetical protein